MGFGDGLKKRKVEDTMKETILSPPPPPMTTENAERPETESPNPGNDQRKAKKRVKTMAKKKITYTEIPFEPLVLEMRIVISTMEESTLFVIQSTYERFCPDLDRNLSDINTEA